MFKVILPLSLSLLMLVNAQAAETLNDPMQPPQGVSIGKSSGKTTRTKTGSAYHLSSIRIAKDHRLAMINGKLLTPGERIGKARVIDIMANHVTLQIDGKRKTLSLLPISIKKPVEAIQ